MPSRKTEMMLLVGLSVSGHLSQADVSMTIKHSFVQMLLMISLTISGTTLGYIPLMRVKEKPEACSNTTWSHGL